MPQAKKVALFIPCFIDQLYPETGYNMVKILEWAGCQVSFNKNQTCCGQPAYNAGFFPDACNVAQKFLTDFNDPSCYVVAPSASCIGMVRNSYPNLLPDDPRVQELASRTYEFTEFLIDVLKVTAIPQAEFPARAVYHDSCSALRELGVKSGPRKLLSSVKGLEIVPLPDAEQCCGFGGTFAVKFEGISTAMAAQKVERAMSTRAQYLISTDSSCLMHLQAYTHNAGFSLKTMHLIDVLASGW